MQNMIRLDEIIRNSKHNIQEIKEKTNSVLLTRLALVAISPFANILLTGVSTYGLFVSFFNTQNQYLITRLDTNSQRLNDINKSLNINRTINYNHQIQNYNLINTCTDIGIFGSCLANQLVGSFDKIKNPRLVNAQILFVGLMFVGLKWYANDNLCKLNHETKKSAKVTRNEIAKNLN